MADITEILDYYQNLLIIQYNNKEKAKKTVRLLVDELLASGIALDVRDGYNLDTAVGVQLDIIGKYVGVDRFYTTNEFTEDYFGFADASNVGGVSANIVGFDDADSPDKEGFFLDSEEVIRNDLRLNDAAYRTLIKLRIAQNNSTHSAKSISDLLFLFFGDSIIFIDTYLMKITYLVGETSSALIKAAIEKEVFPKPAAVRLEAIDGVQFFGLADANNLDAVPDYISGFNDADVGFVQVGRFLDANNDIIS